MKIHIICPAPLQPSQIVASLRALETSSQDHLIFCLARHVRGDRCNIYDDDKVLDDQALIDDFCLSQIDE